MTVLGKLRGAAEGEILENSVNVDIQDIMDYDDALGEDFASLQTEIESYDPTSTTKVDISTGFARVTADIASLSELYAALKSDNAVIIESVNDLNLVVSSFEELKTDCKIEDNTAWLETWDPSSAFGLGVLGSFVLTSLLTINEFLK